MRSSSSTSTDIIDIAAKAQRLDVDNRISIRYYFRIANNILRQADIFRAEKNIIDLYVMLLRFSSLVSETIPCHRGYRAFPQNNKDYLRKKLLISLTELEELKPVVQKKIDELNRRQARQLNGWGLDHQNDVLEWPPVRKKSLNNDGVTKAVTPVARQSVHQGSRIQLQLSHVRPVEEQFRRITLNYPRPKEDTLSRHSILGANGLSGQWLPPRINEGIKYPSITDLTPIEIPSLQQSRADELPLHSDSNGAEPQKPSSESIISVDNVKNTGHTDEPDALISFETTEIPVQTEIIRQPSPPPVLAEVQDLIPAMSQAPETEHAVDISSPIDLARSESPLQLHISTTMMETFMKLAKSNTSKNLETCGVLAGLLKNRKFFVTALIIPKQESTSDTCHTTNEEEIFEVQDKRSLFPLGWIHTHPTQSCFMSSVDVHTHYSYQIMLPESVAIVMAPKDISRTHGIFRLTTPGGMSVIRHCQQRGFHSHEPPSDGGPIYKACTDVYMNPNLNFEVIDLRGC